MAAMPPQQRSLLAPAAGAAVALEGILERVVYESAEATFCVVRLKVAGRRDPVTAVGTLFGVQPGESLKLTGRWVQDKKYGEQFQVESWLTMQPSTLHGIERYLGSGLVQGVGRVMARRLVGRFGIDTLDVIDREPERLTEVEGIGAVRSRAIQRAWQQQRQIHQVMVFLQGHGVAAHHAVKIYKTYGDDAMRVVSETPYRLATDVWGIGFQTADAIASRLGLPADSPARLAAGLLHALSRAADEGHLFLPRAELLAAARELLGVDEALLPPALAELAAAEKVIVERRAGDEAGAGTLFDAALAVTRAGAGDDAVYLIAFFLAERAAAQRLRRLIAFPLPPVAIDVERACRWFEQRFSVALAPAQHEAIRRAVLGKVLVLHRRPGHRQDDAGARPGRDLRHARASACCSPPLPVAPPSASPRPPARRPRRCTACSSGAPRAPASSATRSARCRWTCWWSTRCRWSTCCSPTTCSRRSPSRRGWCLVGDADQLPSVGPGNVLAELLGSGVVPSVRLSRIFRQDGAGLIVANAHRVLGGEMPVDPAEGVPSDFFSIEREDPDECLDTLRRLVAERIPGRFGLDPRADVQVLSPMRRGRLGTISLNTELQALLNPGGAPVEGSRGRLRIGDRVLQTRNDYQLEVFNGDLGRVEAVDDVAAEVLVRYDERIVRYPAGELDPLELAYACSIHKSQGSEYPCVVVVLHREHYVLLQRNLLYTAMTRGKRLVVLLGSRSAVRRAVKNADPQKRYTRLAERLRA